VNLRSYAVPRRWIVSEAFSASANQSNEVPVEELLRRARPLPPLEESVISDLTEEEEEAFLAAIAR
jgi:hypothetical protein